MREPVRRDRQEDGFILPGVVMFVLVLTIIGIFALLALELRSPVHAPDAPQDEAFYEASGAIDRHDSF
jgi:Tfp pilus assembly protein PilX